MAEELATVETTALAQQETGGPLRPADVQRQVQLIQEVMAAVMKEGEHYGAIPGCGTKPALLQPGAQVLALMFRMAPTFVITKNELPNLHREYEITCRLVSRTTAELMSEGVGTCSTMESKYRYREVSDFEVTGDPIPADAKERKAEYRKQGFGMKKIDGVWEWVCYKNSAKVENPDIADTYNTVLKMATKRAFVHATLNATAASDMFTQDIEDQVTQQPAAPEQVSPEILERIRSLRKELAVTDATYADQLEHYGVTSDDDLSAEAAHRLLTTYETRKARLANHDEVQF